MCSSTAQRLLQDEDVREGELPGPESRADGGLRQHPGPLPHVWLPVLPRDGRPLADVRAAPLQRQDDVPEARRVQELQGDGIQWHEAQLCQAYNGFLLKQSERNVLLNKMKEGSNATLSSCYLISNSRWAFFSVWKLNLHNWSLKWANTSHSSSLVTHSIEVLQLSCTNSKLHTC